MIVDQRDVYKEWLREQTELKNVLEATNAVLSDENGELFIKYLMKSMLMTHLPAKGLQGVELHETLGMLSAGRALLDLLMKANPRLTSQYLAELETERIAIEEKETREAMEKNNV